MSVTPVLAVQGLSKSVQDSSGVLTILHTLSFQVRQGESVAIVGASGSGKSTLLSLLAGLDTPSTGSVLMCGKNLATMTEDQRAAHRAQHVGFVFQNFNLIPVMTVAENVDYPLFLADVPPAERRARVAAQLAAVGLAEHAHHRPDALSGGQRQRVAIARALIKRPSLVIADEPTANLDAENSQLVIELMRDMNQRHNVTFLFSTHDPRLIDKVGRLIKLADGQLVNGEHA